MRKYKITAFVGMESHSKTIEAKNSIEANQKALDYGHKMSSFGGGGFLRGVKVTAVKSSGKK